MTTKDFLLKKEINWARIEAAREEIEINRQTIKAIKDRNAILHSRMHSLAAIMQMQAEELDKEYI